MLPAPHRLHNAASVALLFQSGKRASFQEFVLLWRPNESSLTKIGCIAGKKHFPKAVDRNRAKRLAREALRPLLFQLRPGFDMILMYRFCPKRLDAAAVGASVRTILTSNHFLTPFS